MVPAAVGLSFGDEGFSSAERPVAVESHDLVDVELATGRRPPQLEPEPLHFVVCHVAREYQGCGRRVARAGAPRLHVSTMYRPGLFAVTVSRYCAGPATMNTAAESHR